MSESGGFRVRNACRKRERRLDLERGQQVIPQPDPKGSNRRIRSHDPFGGFDESPPEGCFHLGIRRTIEPGRNIPEFISGNVRKAGIFEMRKKLA
jgi:hypothetical protein